MSFIKRVLNLIRGERLSRDIQRELSFHLRERVEELRAQGVPEHDALLTARREFGNPTFQGERVRDADIVTWLDSILGDIRYALRALRRSPAFTTVAVASLALGIGANTAIYTLLDTVVLRALPVPQPEQLAMVTMSDTDTHGYFTNPLWEQVRDRQTGFSAIAAFAEQHLNTADGGEVRHVNVEMAGGDYFALFGMRAALGRLFTRADDVRGCAAMAVLGHDFWLSEYGGQASAVGQTIRLEGQPFPIIGVLQAGFNNPEVGREAQVYVPMCSEAVIKGERSMLDRRSSWWMRVIGRMEPGMTVAQLRTRLAAIAPASYEATVPEHWGAQDKVDYRGRTFSARSAEHGVSTVRERYSGALRVMMGAVALVLLIACANVANLLLARAAARQREVAIRLAVGAARRRVVRQLLTESAILAFLGAAGGLALAYWGTSALVALISTSNNPVSLDLSLNVRVLGFTALVATITATLFGLIPAWRGTRVSPQTAMKAGGRGLAEGGGQRFRIGKALVVAQVALSLTLLVGAGLLVGSLRNLNSMDPGFTSEGVLIATMDFRRTGVPSPQLRGPQQAILERVRALPGVSSASPAALTPVGRSSWNDEIHIAGFTPAEGDDRLAWFNEVGERYFETMDTRLLAGRDFDGTDVAGAPLTAIVNDAMARKFFGEKSPLGGQFRLRRGDTFSEPYTVVGLVENAKYQNLREDDFPTVYLPTAQNADGNQIVNLVLRATGNPLSLVSSIKSIVADAYGLAALTFTTLDAQLDRSLQRERMLAVLSALFGGVALALSMLGLYGVMAYTVARRRNEIGVRIALGADEGRVLRMVLGDVARVVGIGLLLGAAGALASGKLVSSFLYGMEPAEPAIMALAAAGLAAVALMAGLIPALRASRLDPVAALREE